jgi:hypothetical protein
MGYRCGYWGLLPSRNCCVVVTGVVPGVLFGPGALGGRSCVLSGAGGGFFPLCAVVSEAFKIAANRVDHSWTFALMSSDIFAWHFSTSCLLTSETTSTCNCLSIYKDFWFWVYFSCGL